MKHERKSLYIRKRGSKPNHSGGYNKGMKIYKQRNHAHDYWYTENTRGERVTLCKVPRCKYKKVDR